MTSAIETIKPISTESSSDVLRYAQLVGKHFSTLDGTREVVLAAKTGAEWSSLIWKDPTSKRAVQDLNLIDMTFAIPEFIANLCGLSDLWHCFWHSDDSKETENLAKGVAGTGVSGAESLLLFQETGLLELKNFLSTIKGIFWGALTAIAGLELLSIARKETILAKVKAKAVVPEVIDFCDAKRRIVYFSLIKTISLLAISILALISLFAPSLAYGVLFSPVAGLVLTTVYLTAKITQELYEKCLNLKVKNLSKNYPSEMKLLNKA